VGPVCWLNQGSYGRGAGTIPPCSSNKEKQSGLCYTPCKDGYQGKGPVCWREGTASYGRGAGTPLKSICESGKEADAGLCYTLCKADYNGIGPVCWGSTPTGYIDCAAGFAKDKTKCGTITAGQVAAVGMFFATAVPGGLELKAAIQAKKAATSVEELKKAKELLDEAPNIIDKAKKLIKENLVSNNKGGQFVDELHKAFKELPYKDQLGIKVGVRSFKTTGSVGAGLAGDQTSPIDLLRDLAEICSIVDETGVMSVVAAFMYPVYGVDYGKL
jgi:hypothetical protein